MIQHVPLLLMISGRPDNRFTGGIQGGEGANNASEGGSEGVWGDGGGEYGGGIRTDEI
jgi:hypothetical protein